MACFGAVTWKNIEFEIREPLRIFIIVIVLSFCSCQYYRCPSYAFKEPIDNCGGCGICQNLRRLPSGYDSREAYCNFSFTNYFHKNLDCKVVDQCVKGRSECKQSPCIHMLGTFRCLCDSNKYGRTCKYDAPPGVTREDYAVVQEVVFPPVFVYDEIATISVFFSSIGKDLEVVYESDYEEIYFTSEKCKKVDVQTYCKKWYKDQPNICERNSNINSGAVKCVLTVQMYSPPNIVYEDYILPKYIYYVIRKGEFPPNVGVKTPFKIRVYNKVIQKGKNPVFLNEFVSLALIKTPHIGKCVIFMSLYNTGPSNGTRIQYARRDGILIPINIDFQLPICKKADSVKWHWLVWKMKVNHEELYDKPFQEIFDKKSIFYKPFSLAIGYYKVKISVTVYIGKDRSFRFNYGFFEIISLKLAPIILGGEQVCAYYDSKTLILDGSSSYDPDLSVEEQHNSLEYFWSCDKKDPMCKVRRSDYSVTYTGPFLENETYMFTLIIVSKKNKRRTASARQKVLMTSSKQGSLGVVCKKNCGSSLLKSDSNEVIYLVAVIGDNLFDPVVNWNYSSIKNESLKPIEQIRQKKTPSNILIILKNALSEDQVYTFQAEIMGVRDVCAAKFVIKTAKKVDNFTCKAYSKYSNTTSNLQRATSEIEVSCDTLKYITMPPVYSFYNTYPESNDSLRLIAVGRSNTTLFRPSRGKIVVEVTNEHGVTGSTELLIDLLDLTDYTKLILNEAENLKINGSVLDLASRINKMSIILDLITNEKHTLTSTNITNIMDQLLEYASSFAIKDISSVKILTNLMDNIACSDFGLKENFSINSINSLSKIVNKLSDKLLFEIQSSKSECNDLTIGGVHKLCKIMLCICNRVFNSTNIVLMNQVKNISPKDHALHRETSYFLVGSVRRIMLCIALKNLPYESPVEMKEDNIQIWTKEDTVKSFISDGAPSVVVSEKLAKSMKNVSKFFVLQVADYDGDPYKYNQEVDVNTNAIDIVIRYKHENTHNIVEIHQPVGIKLKHSPTKKTVVTGSVQQPDHERLLHHPSDELEDMADLRVAVYQLRIPQTGQLHVKFLNLEDGQVFKVIAMLNMRPDYKYLMNKGNEINKNHSSYHTTLEDPHSYDIYDLYYLGILPGENASVPPDHFVNYTFEIIVDHCVGWKIYEWDTYDCSIVKTKPNELYCNCGYLSTFAGSLKVPIMKIDPFKDMILILTPQQNDFFPSAVLTMLLIFCLFLIWAIFKDCKDKFKGCAIYLEDNFPDDEFAYLVAVYTGNKFFSGTTSSVGFILEGDYSCSRPHMLESPSYRTLQRGDDNWFILFAPIHLGKLELIHLWMNYSGRNPEWYCYKIVVFDFFTNDKYLFLVDSWISLRGEHFIERFEKVTNFEEVQEYILFNDNLIFGLRETHPLVSLFLRHPRSSVTRAQRVAIAFSGLAVLMLVISVFYALIGHKEDLPEYKIELKEFVIGMIGLVVTLVYINLLASAFRKTAAFKSHNRIKAALEYDDIQSVASSEYGLSNKRRNAFMRLCEAILKTIVKPKQFKPVLLDKIEFKFKVQNKLVILGVFLWIVSLAFILLCSLMTVYLCVKLEKFKSFMWLTCLIISLTMLVIIVIPVKVFIVAVMSLVFSKNFYKVSYYKIKYHYLVKYKARYVGKAPELYFKFITLRSRIVYIPLSYAQFLKKLHKQRKKDAMWLLLDLFLAGLLVVLLFFQNENLWTTKYYWHNKQLTSLLSQGFREQGFQLYKLTDMSVYSVFLDEFVFPLIYQTTWYNDLQIGGNDSFEDSSFMFDGTSKLFGLPRLRQLRLRPDLCVEPLLNGLTSRCDVVLTKDTEDKDVYGEAWTSKKTPETVFKLYPWNASESDEGTIYGFSSQGYHGDGYVTDLAMSEERSEDILLYLGQKHWLDNLTSIVIFELSTYNAFTGTFSWLVSITENLHMGMLMNKVYVMTVSYGYTFSIFDALIFSFLLIFTSVRVFYMINRHGIDKLANKVWNLIEISIICLAVCAAFLFFANLKTKMNYLHLFDFDTREHYFEFFHLMKYLFEFQLFVSLLLVLLVCRFIKCCSFSKTLNLYIFTLFSKWNQLLWIVFFVFMLLFIHWKVVSYLINKFLLLRSTFIIIYKLDFKRVVKRCHNVSCTVYLFLLCLIAYVASLFVVLYFFSTYRIVKRKYNEVDYFNFFTIFCKKPEEYEFASYNRKKTLKSFSL